MDCFKSDLVSTQDKHKLYRNIRLALVCLNVSDHKLVLKAPTQQTHDRSLSLAVPKRTHKMRSKDRLVTRNLSLSLRARDKIRDEEEGVEGIYMTVVKETI